MEGETPRSEGTVRVTGDERGVVKTRNFNFVFKAKSDRNMKCSKYDDRKIRRCKVGDEEDGVANTGSESDEMEWQRILHTQCIFQEM